MGNYADQDAIVDLYGEDYLTIAADRDHNGEIDPDVVEAAIIKAESLLNSHIRSKYPVVVPPIPDVLTLHTINVAIYILSTTSDTLTTEKRERYKDAVSWAKDVAACRASLDDPSGPAALSTPVVSAEPRIWTRTTTRGLY